MPLHPLGVLGVEKTEFCLRLLRGLKGVHEADASNGFVVAGLLEVGVLDVHGGDVVGQQHHFVAVQFVPVLVRQPRLGHAAHEVDDEVAGADKGIEDVDAGIAEGAAELGLQQLLHARDHEIDDRLRGVDDAVGVRHLDGEALEEVLIDGVEEVLLLGEVRDGGGGGLDGDVEAVELLEELVAAEGAAGQGGDDLLDLVRR